MKISEYLEKENMNITQFAIKCHMSFHKMYRITRGMMNPTLETAYIINKMSNGEVSYYEMLPDKSKKIIGEKYV